MTFCTMTHSWEEKEPSAGFLHSDLRPCTPVIDRRSRSSFSVSDVYFVLAYLAHGPQVVWGLRVCRIPLDFLVSPIKIRTHPLVLLTILSVFNIPLSEDMII